MSDRTMQILIINYYYPPVVDAHAYRWEQIARYWVSQGHRVEVITGRALGVLNYSVDDGVRITRVGLIARPTKLSFPRNSTSNIVTGFRTALLNLLRPIYRLLYWPDAMWHWIPSVLFEVLRRRSKKYDLVVSYYPCIGAHVAAAALKNWSKFSNLTWIADYGDPFSTSTTMPPNNFALYRRLNLLLERNFAGAASFCVFTNEDTAAKYRELICPPEKVRVIPHLGDIQNLYAGLRLSRQTPTGYNDTPQVINLVYIGGFHRGIREPTLLFDLIRQINKNTTNKFNLTIFGPENGFNLTPEDCPYIKYMGVVAREKAIELMREADILINIDNENCVMAPSKLVEYIGTGRPLINLGKKSTEHAALQRYAGSGHAFLLLQSRLLSDVKSVEKFILNKFYEVAPLDDVMFALKGHTLEAIADDYKNISIKKDQFS